MNFINAAGDSLLAGPGMSIPGGVDVPATATVDYTWTVRSPLELMEMDCAGVGGVDVKQLMQRPVKPCRCTTKMPCQCTSRPKLNAKLIRR